MPKQEYQTKKINLQNCPVCGNPEITSFFHTENVPVFCNVLWDNREKAMAAPLADINLVYCNKCGLIYNITFDNKLMQYSESYENSLHFSPRFRKWANQTADRLVKKYQLYNKDIIEIGCGQGDFLQLLQRLGNNRVLGFDPSYNPDKKDTNKRKPEINIIPKAYSENFDSHPADFICCRHVLEHIEKPLEFLKRIRKTIDNKKNCVVYFEVPNALFTIKHLGIWDIIYEHCSYFTSQSIANLFIQAGFEPIEIAERYEGQFLTIEARPSYEDTKLVTNQQWIIPDMQQLINNFQNVYLKKTNSWKKQLAELENQNSRTVIWGAGSKGVTFVNTMNISHRQIEHFVDLNPEKLGKFVPGTAQAIAGPDFLKEYCPRTIIIMNPIYESEIKEDVKRLGLKTNFLTG